MSKRNVMRVYAPIDVKTRATLLRIFRPRFENVYCRQLTWQYDAESDLEWPKGEQDCIVYGWHIGDGHEALVCVLGGHRFQPGGKRLHVTLSTEPGVQPACAGDIDPDRIEAVDRVTFRLALQRGPAWQTRPESRVSALG